MDLEKGVVTVPLVRSGDEWDVRSARDGTVAGRVDISRDDPPLENMLVLNQEQEHSTAMVVDGSNLPTPGE